MCEVLKNAPISPSQEGAVSREKERDSRHSSERFEPKKKPVSKQPLPGFHQAFGSTEIGKFSRSEFFVNMVGESGGTSDVGDAGDSGDGADVSRERAPLLETTDSTAATAAATAAIITAATATTAAVTDALATATAVTTTGAGSRTFDAEDSQATFAIGEGAVGGAYCGQPTAPRWHSPHVGAIGSEI